MHPANCNCLIHKNGKDRFIKVKGTCKYCNGTGSRKPRVHLVRCKYCNGTGTQIRRKKNDTNPST